MLVSGERGLVANDIGATLMLTTLMLTERHRCDTEAVRAVDEGAAARSKYIRTLILESCVSRDYRGDPDCPASYRESGRADRAPGSRRRPWLLRST